MFGSNLIGSTVANTTANTLNLSKILSGAGKTLTFVNKVIPMYYQIKPVLGNAKTLINMYSVMKEPNKTPKLEEKPKEEKKEKVTTTSNTKTSYSNDTLTFFQ